MPTASTTHDTPLGALTLLAGTSGLTGVRFDAAAGENDDVADRSVVLGASVRRLAQDMAGDRERFDLDVGSPKEATRMPAEDNKALVGRAGAPRDRRRCAADPGACGCRPPGRAGPRYLWREFGDSRVIPP